MASRYRHPPRRDPLNGYHYAKPASHDYELSATSPCRRIVGYDTAAMVASEPAVTQARAANRAKPKQPRRKRHGARHRLP